MLHWTFRLKGGRHRDFHAGVAVGHKAYYFKPHGNEYDIRMDVHVFNTVTLRWEKSPRLLAESWHPLEVPSKVPARLDKYTTVLIGHTIYLWGWRDMYSKKYISVLFEFDVDTHRWFKPKVSGTVPEAYQSYSVCVLGKVIYIYGRYNHRPEDIYKLDTSTMLLSLINTRGIPPDISSYDFATIIGKKMLFCGYWGNNWIRVFDTETDSWLETPSAHLPERPAWGYDNALTYNGELYMFVGRSKQDCGITQYLWKFNPGSNSWKKVELKGNGPGPTYTMCCCMVGDRVLFPGGQDTTDELYILDVSPSLKTLCKLKVLQYDLEQSDLPHNIRWELAPMTTNSNEKKRT